MTHGKKILLDAFCCAGGASMGYHRAGFEVVGVDHKPQRNYPFEFIQTDAIKFIEARGKEFDVIHASPPCQAFSRVTALQRSRGKVYVNLIEETRAALKSSGRPFIIENVPGSPIRKDLILSGFHFGLRVVRIRWFEIEGFFLLQPGATSKRRVTIDGDFITVTGAGGQNTNQASPGEIKIWKGSWKKTAQFAMGIDWMSWKEMTQAIPPAYTKYIGQRILEQI